MYFAIPFVACCCELHNELRYTTVYSILASQSPFVKFCFVYTAHVLYFSVFYACPNMSKKTYLYLAVLHVHILYIQYIYGLYGYCTVLYVQYMYSTYNHTIHIRNFSKFLRSERTPAVNTSTVHSTVLYT